MSSVMLFLEIERIKNKIDTQMNMAIWPKFFTLLGDPDATIDIPMSEFQDFLVTVAQLSQATHTETNAALTSQFATTRIGGGGATTAVADNTTACPFPGPSQNVLNLFPTASARRANDRLDNNLNMVTYRKNCQKLLKHYALTNTTSAEFKISDLVSCMVYLAKSPKYRPLYLLIEDSLYGDYDCNPNYSSQEMMHLVDLLRNLLDMPTTILDFGNIQIMKNTLNKAMNYPIARYPRVIVAQSAVLSKDKRCTLEELLVERGKLLNKMESMQFMNPSESNRIPYCDDVNFINQLMKIVDDFPVHRMFYNAANAIFYTTMDNYATANCKFEIKDYNELFAVMDDISEYNAMSSKDCRKANITDSLNVYLGNASKRNTADGLSSCSSNTLLSKRKKY
ncbi:P40 [Rachiplusia nu nucleopolyhedrovirus]|uniref:P40 n=1 Tax=Rachiplusia nu nucleopolyhedrovirus TaxID=2605775 RepID=A0AAE6M6K1_9ABAC|nr:P40 [Rachiplusia nu nucleopolyhedrovirus]QEI03682.1 P40 [Rachiplusia nu nucleopolyhedrovirus]